MRQAAAVGWIVMVLVCTRPAEAASEPEVRVAVAPEYPALASAARVTGDVTIEVEVDADGAPARTSILHGHPLFNESVLLAAREWRFSSIGRATLSFKFSLVPESACAQKGLSRFRVPNTFVVVARYLEVPCSDCGPVARKKTCE